MIRTIEVFAKEVLEAQPTVPMGRIIDVGEYSLEVRLYPGKKDPTSHFPGLDGLNTLEFDAWNSLSMEPLTTIPTIAQDIP